MSDTRVYDLIIVGGGASGLMAGSIAKDRGLDFLILEKNATFGRKLAITGKGRCNITNNTHDLKTLVNQYYGNKKFLFTSFSNFDVPSTISYFENNLHIKTKIERGGRVFPESDKAGEVINAFLNKLRGHLLSGTTVKTFVFKNNKISEVKTNNGTFKALNFLICTGGKTYPLTGSTGDGYKWAKELGHTVTTLKPALVGVELKDSYVTKIAGLSLKNIEISVVQNEKILAKKLGEMLFTHKGISGPIVIDLSRTIGDALELGDVFISIDLKPGLTEKMLTKRLNSDLQNAGNQYIKNSLGELLPQKLIPIVISRSNVDSQTKASQLTKEQRKILVKTIKSFILSVKSTEGWENAIVTAGGINSKEIDSKTLKSKLIKNLYFAGEIIDIHGPTGGYNLQMCWSTAFTAVSSL